MEGNIFIQENKKMSLADYMMQSVDGRENLGDHIPVQVYRLLEYSIREQLTEQFGKEEQIRIFRNAGFRAGRFFAENMLDLTLPLPQFVALLQKKTAEMKIGVLKIEKYEEKSGKMILTVSEDADCSGLPMLGETVCNYDEGFISGILSTYTGKKYSAIEVDCWATGDRVCRFRAEVME